MKEQELLLDSPSNKSFPFFRILYRNLTMILIVIAVSVIFGAIYGIGFVKPVYTAKCDAIFKVELHDSVTSATRGTSLAKSSLPTFSDFIKTPIVEQTARDTSGDKGISRGAVSINYLSDSLIVSISYTAATPDVAKTRLKAYIDAADAVLKDNKKKPIENARNISLEELQNEYIIKESNDGSNYIFIGFIAGIVLGVTLSVLRYLLDNKLKDKDELEEITGVSLLSYIDKQ